MPESGASPKCADGDHVAVPVRDGTVRLISLESGREVRSYPAPQINAGKEMQLALAAAISPDANKLAAGYGDHAIRVWDFKTGEVLRDVRTANQMTSGLAFFSDNRRLAAGGSVVETSPDSPTACVVDTETGDILAATPAILGDGWAFALAPDQRHLLTAGGAYFSAKGLKWERTDDYALHLWQLPESVWPAPLSGAKEIGSIKSLQGFRARLLSLWHSKVQAKAGCTPPPIKRAKNRSCI